MSSGLAVACVTAVLKNLLENAFVKQGLGAVLGDVHVSALPPDRVPIGADQQKYIGETEKNLRRIFATQRRVLPSAHVRSRFRGLGPLNIAGGHIRNSALNAAFLAGDADEPVHMLHLLRAAQTEYAKLEKPLTEAEIEARVGA